MDKDLTTLYQDVNSWTQDKINWYDRHAKRKRLFSKAIRYCSIFIVIVAGVLPFLEATVLKDKTVVGVDDFSMLGYILLYIAGAANLWDRFAGFSSGWLRYTITRVEIEILYTNFLDEWYFETYCKNLNECVPPEELSKLKLLVDSLRDAVMALEKSETEAWATEFRNTQKELSELVKTRRDSLQKNIDERRQQQKANLQLAEEKAQKVNLELLFKNYQSYDSIAINLSKDGVSVYKGTISNQINKVIPNLDKTVYILALDGQKGGVSVKKSEQVIDLSEAKGTMDFDTAF